MDHYLYQFRQIRHNLLVPFEMQREDDILGEGLNCFYPHCIMEEKKPPIYTAKISYSLVNEDYWRDKRRKEFPHYCEPRGQHNKPMFCGTKLWRKIWTFNETTGAMRPLK